MMLKLAMTEKKMVMVSIVILITYFVHPNNFFIVTTMVDN